MARQEELYKAEKIYKITTERNSKKHFMKFITVKS